jgi:pantoate--beta-alanine ligase
MPLQVIEDPREMRIRSEDLRRDARVIVLVPTMGYLHDGHVSLLREGRGRGDALVISIFVNPTQFGPSEDFARYPRDLAGDLDKARAAGVDLAFVPSVAAMYPREPLTRVLVDKLADGLCGPRRPGHFAGVATVVAKLFQLCQPNVAIFGEKDYQQLTVIRRMVADLDLGVEVVGMPIVREPDGLAMSSRNAYLSPEDRVRALSLSRALAAAEARFRAGERDAARLVETARATIVDGVTIDYVELVDADMLQPLAAVTRPAVLALAAFVGATRLIDNRVLKP